MFHRIVTIGVLKIIAPFSAAPIADKSFPRSSKRPPNLPRGRHREATIKVYNGSLSSTKKQVKVYVKIHQVISYLDIRAVVQTWNSTCTFLSLSLRLTSSPISISSVLSSRQISLTTKTNFSFFFVGFPKNCI